MIIEGEPSKILLDLVKRMASKKFFGMSVIQKMIEIKTMKL